MRILPDREKPARSIVPVETLAAYAHITRYLDSLSSVTHVGIGQLTPSGVSYALRVNGGLQDLTRIVSIGTVLEPVPGIPPTASHIKELTGSLQGKDGIVLHTTFQPERAPQALAKALGWPVVRLPLEPPLGSAGPDYLAHIDRWVEAIMSRP